MAHSFQLKCGLDLSHSPFLVASSTWERDRGKFSLTACADSAAVERWQISWTVWTVGLGLCFQANNSASPPPHPFHPLREQTGLEWDTVLTRFNPAILSTPRGLFWFLMLRQDSFFPLQVPFGKGKIVLIKY